MRDEAVRHPGVVINHFTDFPAGIDVEEAEGHMHYAPHRFFPYVGFNPESGKMR